MVSLVAAAERAVRRAVARSKNVFRAQPLMVIDYGALQGPALIQYGDAVVASFQRAGRRFLEQFLTGLRGLLEGLDQVLPPDGNDVVMNAIRANLRVFLSRPAGPEPTDEELNAWSDALVRMFICVRSENLKRAVIIYNSTQANAEAIAAFNNEFGAANAEGVDRFTRETLDNSAAGFTEGRGAKRRRVGDFPPPPPRQPPGEDPRRPGDDGDNPGEAPGPMGGDQAPPQDPLPGQNPANENDTDDPMDGGAAPQGAGAAAARRRVPPILRGARPLGRFADRGRGKRNVVGAAPGNPRRMAGPGRSNSLAEDMDVEEAGENSAAGPGPAAARASPEASSRLGGETSGAGVAATESAGGNPAFGPADSEPSVGQQDGGRGGAAPTASVLGRVGQGERVVTGDENPGAGEGRDERPMMGTRRNPQRQRPLQLVEDMRRRIERLFR